MTDAFLPERDPELRLCKFCGSSNATRWDGGMGGVICLADGGMIPITKTQYCCESCDRGHNWFDLEEEDFQ